jgi:hypothetical protein
MSGFLSVVNDRKGTKMKGSNRARPGVRLCTLAGLTAGLLLACFVVSGAALAARGNSANAKLCQKGGWQTAQTSTGGAFASQDECVAYGAQGGTVFAPSVTVNPTHVPEETDSFMTVSGFHPLSVGELKFDSLGGADGSITFLGITTNAAGGLPVFSTSFTAGACADGATGEQITYTDGSGVHASATVTLDCP